MKDKAWFEREMFIVIALTFDHFSAAVENAFHPTQYPNDILLGYCYLYKCYNNTGDIFCIIFSSINVNIIQRHYGIMLNLILLLLHETRLCLKNYKTNLNEWKEDW